MKNEIKTIIIGIATTLLVVLLALFILYKIDQNKNKVTASTSANNNDTFKIESNIKNESEKNNSNTKPNTNTNNQNKQETTPTISNSKEENNNSSDEKTNNKVILYLFHGNGCGACKNAIAKLKETKNSKYQNVDIKTYEVWSNQGNQALMMKVAEKINVTVNGVPFFVIGNDSIIGYNEENILKKIENATKDKNYKDNVAEAINENKDLNIAMEPIK